MAVTRAVLLTVVLALFALVTARPHAAVKENDVDDAENNEVLQARDEWFERLRHRLNQRRRNRLNQRRRNGNRKVEVSEREADENEAVAMVDETAAVRENQLLDLKKRQ